MELYPGYLEDHFNIHKLSSTGGASPPEYMTTASTQYAPAPLGMGMYERHQQPHAPPPPPQQQPVVGMWNSEPYKVDSGGQATSGSTIMEGDTKFDHTGLEDVPHMDELEEGGDADQEASKPRDKVLRRLAQNREAARKSRLRKKAYIQQLETSRIKLAQLEQELQRARQQVHEETTQQQSYTSSNRIAAPAFAEELHCCMIDAARRIRRSESGGRPVSGRVRGGGADGPRRGRVRARLRALGGRAGPAHAGAARRAAGPGHVGAGAADAGGDRPRQLRQPLPDQERRRLLRRVLRHVRPLALPRRALLPLDRRLPALRSPQYPEPAAAATDGPADGGGVQPAAVVGAGGGRAVAGHGEAAADAVGGPDGHRRRPLRRPRRLQHGVDQRGGEAQGPRRLRAAGGPSPAGDAAEHAQDPDDAAGGEGPSRAGRLLPASPRAQLVLGGAPARVGDKLRRTNGGN